MHLNTGALPYGGVLLLLWLLTGNTGGWKILEVFSQF